MVAFWYAEYIENNVCSGVMNCLYVHKNIILKSYFMRVCELSYILHDMVGTYKTTIVTHQLPVSIAFSSFCWPRHNRLHNSLSDPIVTTRHTNTEV